MQRPGRDSDKYSVGKYIKEIEDITGPKVKIASVCGRYYALDETRDYRRTKVFYDLLYEGRGVSAPNLARVIEKCYEKKLSDEYLPPIKTNNFSPLKDGDAVMFLNMSKDNQFQFLNSISNKGFDKFDS